MALSPHLPGDMSVEQWQAGLAPGLTRDASGTLCVGGVSVETLIATYGSPLIAMNFDVLNAKAERISRAAHTNGATVSYSGKALLTPMLARFFDDRGIGLDVSSLGELSVAERAGVAPEHLTLHGSGKDERDLAAVVAGRIGCVVVDDLLELAMLHEMAAAEQREVDVIVRCALPEAAFTHRAVTTSGSQTKFGIAARDRAMAWKLFCESTFLRFCGIHVHAGSQIFDAQTFLDVIDALVTFVGESAQAGLTAHKVIAGGGFGVQMHPSDGLASLDVAQMLPRMAERLAHGCRERGLPVPILGIEPGRAFVADAGTTLYRALAVKQQDVYRFVIVDGGLCDNPRPALYDAYHHIICATPRRGEPSPAIVCGRSCENDEIARVELPSDLLQGDLIAVCTTGAYTYSMASNYNRFGRPAVIAIEAGSTQIMARRETFEDILRLDT